MPGWFLWVAASAVVVWMLRRKDDCDGTGQDGDRRKWSRQQRIGRVAGDLAAPNLKTVPNYGPLVAAANSRLIPISRDAARTFDTSQRVGGMGYYPEGNPDIVQAPDSTLATNSVPPQPVNRVRLPVTIEPSIVEGAAPTLVARRVPPNQRISPASLPPNTVSFAHIVGGGQGVRKKLGSY